MIAECYCGVIWTRQRTLRTVHGAGWLRLARAECPDCIKYRAWKAEQ